MDALNQLDTEAMRRLAAPGMTIWQPPVQANQNLDEHIRRLQREGASWKHRKYVIRSIVRSESSYAIVWQLDQMHVRGEQIPVEGLTVLETQDERIVAARNYFDAAAYLKLLAPKGDGKAKTSAATAATQHSTKETN